MFNYQYTLLPALTLIQREIVRFYRQRSRVIGALGTPLVFWLVLGSGFGDSFRASSFASGIGYLEYFFPGAIVLTLLFTSIFSNISVIQDRNEGFLQSVLVAPVSRASIVGGKIFGSTLLALSQGVVFLLLSPFVGYSLSFQGILLSLLGMGVLSLGLSALGFYFAWKLNSIQGFHAIMNLVLFPMWLLSGALFPLASAPVWLKVVMYLNPLTYGVSFLRWSLYSQQGSSSFELSAGLSFLILTVFSIVFYYMATRTLLRGNSK